MFCPKCGVENVDAAKFCKACGAALDVKKTDEVLVDTTDKAPSADQASPKAKDASSQPATANVQEQVADAKAKLSAVPKKTMLIAGAVVAVVVVAIAVFALGTNEGPSDADIENIMKQMKVEERVPASSVWEDNEGFSIQSVKVLQKNKESGDVQSYDRTGAPVSDPYTVKAEAVISNGSTEITEQAPMGVAKVNGEWKLISFDWSDLSVTSTKLIKGVDCKKVKENFGYALDDVKTSGENQMSLIYKDATYKIQEETFDADKKTDKLVIKCTAKNATYDATAKVTALFKYGKDGWEIKSAKADKNAQKVSHQKLVGSWTGKFEEQTDTMDGECFGGKANPIKINVTSVDEDTGKIDGTVTALMHFHQASEMAEDSDSGDTVVENIPFSMAVDLHDFGHTTSNYAVSITTSGSELKDTFTYKRDDKSSAKITIAFAGEDGPTASVDCTYTGGTGFFNWWTFEDTYSLTKDK